MVPFKVHENSIRNRTEPDHGNTMWEGDVGVSNTQMSFLVQG
jgi:hypothetical protein